MRKTSFTSGASQDLEIIGTSRRWDRPGFRRAVIATLAVLIVLMAVVPPAEAASVSYSEEVKLAGGAWIEETETTFSDLTVKVFYLTTRSSDFGKAHFRDPQVTLFYTHEFTDPDTGFVTRTEYEGFAAEDGGTFDFDPKLGTAAASLTLPLYGYVCVEDGPAGISSTCEELPPATVVMDLSWVGMGPIIHDEFGDSVQELPWFKFHNRSVSDSRAAVLTGSVAGDGLNLADGEAAVGVLLIGKYAEETVTPG